MDCFRIVFETCGCLSNNPLLSLRSRAYELKLEKAPSKRTRNTNLQVHQRRSFFALHLPHSPSPVFRDQLYKHLETIPSSDYDAVTNKLIQAGSTLEFLKYSDALFDILIVGGLLQPGGSYLDADGPTSPFSLFQIKLPSEPEDIKKFVEVLNKLIRR